MEVAKSGAWASSDLKRKRSRGEATSTEAFIPKSCDYRESPFPSPLPLFSFSIIYLFIYFLNSCWWKNKTTRKRVSRPIPNPPHHPATNACPHQIHTPSSLHPPHTTTLSLWRGNYWLGDTTHTILGRATKEKDKEIKKLGKSNPRALRRRTAPARHWALHVHSPRYTPHHNPTHLLWGFRTVAQCSHNRTWRGAKFTQAISPHNICKYCCESKDIDIVAYLETLLLPNGFFCSVSSFLLFLLFLFAWVILCIKGVFELKEKRVLRYC